MNGANQKTILKEFQQIPGVSKLLSQDLYDLGYRSLSVKRQHNNDDNEGRNKWK